ncbi:GNAT family N-acetyltransferase [Polycladidibacter hongkongensis]|uniref:GNAT family N-acetyltransferase n=1 Tax=Polycladidibacter hongkongensis TaxID=1647556 RepID=UPI000829F090|nr:GNAT family N-acetyltransferase [Pseudovibrio hongkongensis]
MREQKPSRLHDVQLRNLRAADLEVFWNLGSCNYNVVRWLTGAPWPPQRSNAEDFFSQLSSAPYPLAPIRRAITVDGAFAGTIELALPGDLDDLPQLPTLGYWLGEPFWGKGFASRAVRLILQQAFAIEGVGTVAARAFQDNAGSLNVLSKTGFKIVGACERYSKARGETVACHILIVTHDDFLETIGS